jgi:hypothetical protein
MILADAVTGYLIVGELQFPTLSKATLRPCVMPMTMLQRQAEQNQRHTLV